MFNTIRLEILLFIKFEEVDAKIKDGNMTLFVFNHLEVKNNNL